MPFGRYFLFVGGVLLALLLIADSCLPKLPFVANANADLPVIKIQSERKWPERIVYDTSLPTIIPAQVAITKATVSHNSANVREREAFAQLQSSVVIQPQPIHPRSPNRSRNANTNTSRRAAAAIPLARQARFGWFGNGIW